MLINIIGSGNVGKTLARLFVVKNLVSVAGIYNRTEVNAINAIDFIGQGKYYNNIVDLPKADLTFITTSDSYIVDASQKFFLNENLSPGSIVVHCSGVLQSNSMALLRDKGCYICSIHPMHSFIDPHISVSNYSGTYCAIEGDEEAIQKISNLFVAIGSKLIRVASDKKPLYHAAGVFASNYLLTLASQALACLQEAGISAEDSCQLVVNLMQSTLNNLSDKKNPASALTGPLKRGDFNTINLHLNAFTNKKIKDFYTFMLDKTKEL